LRNTLRASQKTHKKGLKRIKVDKAKRKPAGRTKNWALLGSVCEVA
jgi:hypothetical protein